MSQLMRSMLHTLMAPAEAAAAAGAGAAPAAGTPAANGTSPVAAGDGKPVAAATSAGDGKPAAGADLIPPAALTDAPAKLGPDGKPLVAEAPKPDAKLGPDGKPLAAEPIKYEAFKVPEGMEIDAPMMEKFSALAAKKGMTQEEAQEYVDLYATQVKEASEQPYKLWADTQKQWQEAVRNDPELGGENFDTMRATIANGIDRVLGTEAQAFREALNFTGAGNNPEIIRALYRFATPYAEGGQVTGNPAKVEAPKSFAQVLYPPEGDAASQ